MKTNLHRPDVPLIPLATFPKDPDNFVDIIRGAHIADWSTLHLHAYPEITSFGAAADKTSAVTISIVFLEFNRENQTFTEVAGRMLCVGACEIADGTVFPSYLEVALPIRGSFVSISYMIPANQTNVTDINLCAWVANDLVPYGIGNELGNIFALTNYSADSLLGQPNSSSISSTTQGIKVLPGTTKLVELAEQTIGKGTFHYHVTAETGAVPAVAEVETWIATKAPDDTSGTTSDQRIWTFGVINPATGALGSVTEGQAQGIPLVGFRQCVAMRNASAGGAARNFRWHWAAYPEFT